MAHNEVLTNRVRTALAAQPNVEEKKMFSGITFMVNDKMCVSAGNDRLMLRIDPALHEEAVEKPGVTGVLMRGREYRGYVYVKEDVLKTQKAFDYWIQLALAYNPRAQVSKKKKAR